jgi:hypothetical protein
VKLHTVLGPYGAADSVRATQPFRRHRDVGGFPTLMRHADTIRAVRGFHIARSGDFAEDAR